MILKPVDYIADQERQGRLTSSAKIPELNAEVWRGYLRLYDDCIGPSGELDIIVPEKGPGLYCDPLGGGKICNWALMGPISHPVLPFTADEIIKAAPAIDATLRGMDLDGLLTDTFVVQGEANEDQARHFIWINSPRAAIQDTFDAYAQSLPAARRKQMRRLYRQYNDDPAIRFEFSADLPGSAEVEYIKKHTYARWGEDAAYALVQTLWPMAASAIIPEAVRYMRVYKDGDLVFLNSYILRGDVLTSQSTTRNEDVFLSGLGVMIDFKAIELLSGQGDIRFLDPTCRTGLDDPDSIGIAKREVVNSDALKPILMVGGKNPDPALPYFCKGWHMPDRAAHLGRTAND